MAYTWMYEACSLIGTQINSLGTAPEIISIVPKEYGQYKPNLAKNYWVNLEMISDKTEAETDNSFLIYLKVGIWVWISNLGTLDSVSNVLSCRAYDVRSKLLYNNLGGWSRIGIDNKSMSDGKYIKGWSDTSKYGYYLDVTIQKQITI